MGIVREEVEQAPKASSDLPPQAGDADVAIYGQGTDSPITTTMTIIVGGASVVGK
jgi:hypothetical protein